MKIIQAVLLVAIFGLLLFATGCDSKDAGSSVARKNNLETGAFLNSAGVGVAVADMNGDGYIDIVTASPNGVKYFENNSQGLFVDRGVIGKTGALINSESVEVAIGDVDGNGVPDIITACPNGVRILKNPIPQKK